MPGLLIVPAGREVFYVHSSGAPAGHEHMSDRFFTSVASALSSVRSGGGADILVLSGHTESIDAADAWSGLGTKTNVRVICQQNCTFNWTADAATLLMDAAGFEIQNAILNLAGSPADTAALTVAAAITVSARHCAIRNCIINTGVDANQIITVGITVAAGGDFFTFEDNYCWNGILTAAGAFTSGAAAEITAAGTFLRLTGADGARIRNNTIIASLATDTDGCIETKTTLSEGLVIEDNYIYANGSGNTCAVDFGQDLACTGALRRNLMVVDADGTAETVVFTRHNNCNVALLDNFLVNNNNERGLVIGTASA